MAAGADFIQTQGVYKHEEFKGIMSGARDRGLHTRTCILAGVMVPSAGMLRYMQSSVAGIIKVPDALIQRMSVKDDREARSFGRLIQQLREIEA